MPRYFFCIRDHVDVPDFEGAVLRSVEEARDEALRAARGIMADQLNQGQPLSLDERIEITDEEGQLVDVVTFRQAAGID